MSAEIILVMFYTLNNADAVADVWHRASRFVCYL